MEEAVAEFLRYLSVEKNASALTTKSYREDLGQALDYLRSQGVKGGPETVTTRHLRSFLVWLHEQGYAKTTIARRLAAVRSWLRFLCRRERADGERRRRTPRPAARQEVAALPAGAGDRQAAATPIGGSIAAGAARSGPAGNALLGGTAGQRGDGTEPRGPRSCRGRGRRFAARASANDSRSSEPRPVQATRTLVGGPRRGARGSAARRNRAAVFLNKNGTRLTPRSVGPDGRET